PLRRPVDAGDEGAAMDAAEVAPDERVAGLGLLGGAFGQPQMPGAVLLPRVRRQELVLGRGVGLSPTPLAAQHVLMSVDELLAVSDDSPVDLVSGHHPLSPFCVVSGRW